MGALKLRMTHDEAAAHLRNEVVGTLQDETRPLRGGSEVLRRSTRCDMRHQLRRGSLRWLGW